MTTTFGDLFPELNACRPQKPARRGNAKRNEGPATAQRLQALYPELASWDPFYVTTAWHHWGNACGVELSEPKTRDEAFPEYLAHFIHAKMLELESTIKVRKQKQDRLAAAFLQLEQSGDGQGGE